MCEDWMTECPRCSMFLNLAVWISFLMIFWCASDSTAYNGIVSPQSLTALPIVLFLLLYACYMTECYFATSRKLLSKAMKRESILDYIHRLRMTGPKIVYSAVCWHHETKTRVAPVVDRRGKTRMQTETYRDKAVTLINKELFNYDKWTDLTNIPDDIQEYSMAVVNLTKSFTFKNAPSQTIFTNLSCGFQARHRHVDKYLEYEEEMTLEGFSDHVIAYVSLEGKERWMNIWVYWVCSALLMSWAFRLMLARRTINYDLNIIKELEICMG